MNRRGFAAKMFGTVAAAVMATPIAKALGCQVTTSSCFSVPFAYGGLVDRDGKMMPGVASNEIRRGIFLCECYVTRDGVRYGGFGHNKIEDTHACAVLNLSMRDKGKSGEETALLLHPEILEILPVPKQDSGGRWISYPAGIRTDKPTFSAYDSIEWPVASRPWESGGFIPGKGWFREKNGA